MPFIFLYFIKVFIYYTFNLQIQYGNSTEKTHVYLKIFAQNTYTAYLYQRQMDLFCNSVSDIAAITTGGSFGGSQCAQDRLAITVFFYLSKMAIWQINFRVKSDICEQFEKNEHNGMGLIGTLDLSKLNGSKKVDHHQHNHHRQNTNLTNNSYKKNQRLSINSDYIQRKLSISLEGNDLILTR